MFANKHFHIEILLLDVEWTLCSCWLSIICLLTQVMSLLCIIRRRNFCWAPRLYCEIKKGSGLEDLSKNPSFTHPHHKRKIKLYKNFIEFQFSSFPRIKMQEFYSSNWLINFFLNFRSYWEIFWKVIKW